MQQKCPKTILIFNLKTNIAQKKFLYLCRFVILTTTKLVASRNAVNTKAKQNSLVYYIHVCIYIKYKV